MKNDNHIFFDLDDLNEMSGGDKDFEDEMINYFIGNVPVVIKNMQDAHESRDWEKLRHVAHKFLSNVKVMGIRSAAKIVDRLEDCALRESHCDDIPEMINKIEQILDTTCIQLKMYLKQK